MRAVGALDHDPARLLLDPDLFQQRRQPHAGPFRAADHAVGELQGIELRGAPLHAAIGAAFDEMDARDLRKAHDVLHRQQQRPLDEAVDHQAMFCRIDIRASGMMALEEQAVRRDDAVQVLQRREADGGFFAGGEPGNVAPDHAGLEIGGPAIGPVDHAGADRLRPRRVRRWRSGLGLGIAPAFPSARLPVSAAPSPRKLRRASRLRTPDTAAMRRRLGPMFPRFKASEPLSLPNVVIY